MKNLILVIALALLIPTAAAAQGNAFSFQGRLNDGTTPANGSYDLQFSLHTAIVGGSPIGSPIPKSNTTLVNGVFSVMLDFGATAFNDPNAVFIEIGIKPNGSPNAFTILGPRQQLTVVPFAVRANSASEADSATNASNAQNAQNSNALNGFSSSDFIRNTTTAQPNSNFNISGNGIINGNLIVQGNNTSGGNVQQNRDKNGLVKAMIFVYSNDGTPASILRCYNGVTGATTGNCGFTIQEPFFGKYVIDFGFQVSDRFFSVTAQQNQNIDAGVNISTGFWFPVSPTQLGVKTNVTDISFPDSWIRAPFMVIIY